MSRQAGKPAIANRVRLDLRRCPVAGAGRSRVRRLCRTGLAARSVRRHEGQRRGAGIRGRNVGRSGGRDSTDRRRRSAGYLGSCALRLDRIDSAAVNRSFLGAVDVEYAGRNVNAGNTGQLSSRGRVRRSDGVETCRLETARLLEALDRGGVAATAGRKRKAGRDERTEHVYTQAKGSIHYGVPMSGSQVNWAWAIALWALGFRSCASRNREGDGTTPGDVTRSVSRGRLGTREGSTAYGVIFVGDCLRLTRELSASSVRCNCVFRIRGGERRRRPS